MKQLSLFPIPEARHGGGSFFLAAFPNEFVAPDLYELGIKLRTKYRLSGPLRPLDLLHVSLPIPINASNELEQIIESLDRAFLAIANNTHPFEITFDRTLSFGGQLKKHALVLAGSKDGNAELKTFHRLLTAKLSNGRHANPKFTPHLTLLYDREIAEEKIPPISWMVNKIVLVRSHVGETKYDRLKSWTLGD